MKTLKKAEQQNVLLDVMQYGKYEIYKMIENKEVCHMYWSDNEHTMVQSYERPMFYDLEKLSRELVIFIEDNIKEIKVKLVNGQYKNVAVNKYGKEYYINLYRYWSKA